MLDPKTKKEFVSVFKLEREIEQLEKIYLNSESASPTLFQALKDKRLELYRAKRNSKKSLSVDN